jgi:hypothetical protein
VFHRGPYQLSCGRNSIPYTKYVSNKRIRNRSGDPHQTIILIEAFLKGTKPKFHFDEQIDIDPEELVTPEYNVHFMVTPVIGEEGESWTGPVIFIDQLHRKYKTKEVEFKWAGGPTKPLQKASEGNISQQ